MTSSGLLKHTPPSTMPLTNTDKGSNLVGSLLLIQGGLLISIHLSVKNC